MIFADGSQRRRQPTRLAVAHARRARRATSPPRASRSRRSSRSRSSASPPRCPTTERDAFVAELAPKVARLPPLAVPRATPRRLAAHHAHPPVGVRARLHPAVDDARSARCGCRGGCAPPSSSAWRRCSAHSATTRGNFPPASAPSDDDGLRMLALAVHLCASRLRPRAASRTTTASVLVEDVAFNAFFAAANRSLARAGRRRRRPRSARSTRTPTALETAVARTDGSEYCSRHAVTARADDRPDRRHLPARSSPTGAHVDAARRPGCRTRRPTGRRTRCRASRSRPATSRTTATGPVPPG